VDLSHNRGSLGDLTKLELLREKASEVTTTHVVERCRSSSPYLSLVAEKEKETTTEKSLSLQLP